MYVVDQRFHLGFEIKALEPVQQILIGSLANPAIGQTQHIGTAVNQVAVAVLRRIETDSHQKE
ncbi:TPA: hypothetical protein ACPWM7_005140 [Pseudomonas aeruginosa]